MEERGTRRINHNAGPPLAIVIVAQDMDELRSQPQDAIIVLDGGPHRGFTRRSGAAVAAAVSPRTLDVLCRGRPFGITHAAFTCFSCILAAAQEANRVGKWRQWRVVPPVYVLVAVAIAVQM